MNDQKPIYRTQIPDVQIIPLNRKPGYKPDEIPLFPLWNEVKYWLLAVWQKLWRKDV